MLLCWSWSLSVDTDESAIVCGEFLQARHEGVLYGLIDCPEAWRDCACASGVVAMQRSTGVECSVKVVSNRQTSLSLSVLDFVHRQSMCQDPSPPSPDASGTGSMLSFRQDGNVFESHRSAGRIALEFAMKLLACLTCGTDLVNFPE